ncbi:MAG: 16S rRNA (adenine(1518)-N(6)/adenine(1519)-N(6))-dimethyltransferase RsmA [Methylocystis sp.]
MIDALPPLREVVARFGLDAKKTLGQNFLFDLNLTSRIARAVGAAPDTTIVEIGPGPGGLTRALLAQGARVVVIERDARCLPALEEIAAHYPNQLTIIEDDALNVDLPRLLEELGGVSTARLCANLPYNIATALLTRWIEAEPWPGVFDRYVLMFQKEVARRIVATPMQRADYGRLAVLCGWRTRARILFDVSPAAFTPAPKVTSSVVELTPLHTPLDCSKQSLSRVTQAAFGQRRKMLRQSLKTLGKDPTALLSQAEICETKRAEEISIAEFVKLANLYAQE